MVDVVDLLQVLSIYDLFSQDRRTLFGDEDFGLAEEGRRYLVLWDGRAHEIPADAGKEFRANGAAWFLANRTRITARLQDPI